MQRDFILGVKVVRGAYMERVTAAQMNYPPNKQVTDRDFNEAIEFCIDHINRVAVVVGVSQRIQQSSYHAITSAEKFTIRSFASLFFPIAIEMSDYTTFNLAIAGCHVSKYLPFGPIKDVIPYPMRCAQENTSVKGQTGRELGIDQKGNEAKRFV